MKITANIEEETNRAEFEERNMANGTSQGLTMKQLIKYGTSGLSWRSSNVSLETFKNCMAYIFLVAYWQYING